MITSTNLTIDVFHSAPVFPGKKGDKTRKRHLAAALEQARPDGLVVEFGVFQGYTLNVLARRVTPDQVWGFDSFEGLPEDWQVSSDQDLAAGTFAVDRLPVVDTNAELVVGWFSDTLPIWMERHAGPMRLLHVDCDLYSSARYILATLNSRIVPGTVIVFDDMYSWYDPGFYTNWADGEFRALAEWCKEFDRGFEPLYRTDYFPCSLIVRK
jgi:hypothetical protein